MTTQQTPSDGTWIRSRVPVGDTGDHNEREAPAGALGRLTLVDPGADPNFSVVYWPSFVQNFLTLSEIAEDADILPAGHPDIPSDAEFDLASAVADAVAEGDVDEDTQLVTVPVGVVDRIVAGAKVGRYAADPSLGAIVNRLFAEGGCETLLSFEEFDALAAAAGVADRLSGS